MFYGGCPDGAGVSVECDVWAQDCPRGEKCMPWANDGSGVWNAARCSPLDSNPAQVGEPCTVEGSGVSGIDNCSRGAMCWNVDIETNVGTCVDLCVGSAANPTCTNPEMSCRVLSDVLILCLRECDPLVQDCSDNHACYLADEAFVCLPTNERPDMVGDWCSYIGECEAGLHCADGVSLFDCPASGCCTELCDLEAPDPNAACSGAANGESCTLLLDDGEHPNVGVCRLPD